MTENSGDTAIWEMLAGRWATAITAKNLSPLTLRSYLRTTLATVRIGRDDLKVPPPASATS